MTPLADAESSARSSFRFPSLFGVGRRLWVVTGKGGTGKTSVAAALAALAARAGERVLLASADGDGALPALIEVSEQDASRPEGHVVAPGLTALVVKPEESLAEYVDLQLHVGGLGKRLIGSRAFGAFLDAAPGWRDLVTLGKLWHLEQQRGRAALDRIVFDAPATGHGLSLLSTPQVVLEVIRMGPLHQRASAIRDLLVDARRSQCILVALAEELPVRETLELSLALKRIPIARGPVLVNRCEPEPPRSLAKLRSAVAGLTTRGAPPLAKRAALADALEMRAHRCAQQRRWIDTLGRELAGAPLFRVPDLTDALEGWRGVNRLADALAASLQGASA